MVPIVEDYLSELLNNKFSYLKSNPEYVRRILMGSQSRLDRLVSYIQNNPIKVVKGYPRTPAELPCVCIILSNEDETQDGLGDYEEGFEYSVKESTDEVQIIDTVGARLAVPYVELPHKPIEEIFSIVAVGDDFEEEIDFEITNPELGIVEVFPSSLGHGDTIKVHYSYRYSSNDFMQVLYDANYRIEVWSLNADQVVEMYHLVKWAFLSGREHLGKDRLLIQQRLGGGDFEPATKYFPEFVYRRALTFWCKFNVSSPEDDVRYIESVEVDRTFYSGGESDEY